MRYSLAVLLLVFSTIGLANPGGLYKYDAEIEASVEFLGKRTAVVNIQGLMAIKDDIASMRLCAFEMEGSGLWGNYPQEKLALISEMDFPARMEKNEQGETYLWLDTQSMVIGAELNDPFIDPLPVDGEETIDIDEDGFPGITMEGRLEVGPWKYDVTGYMTQRLIMGMSGKVTKESFIPEVTELSVEMQTYGGTPKVIIRKGNIKPNIENTDFNFEKISAKIPEALSCEF